MDDSEKSNINPLPLDFSKLPPFIRDGFKAANDIGLVVGHIGAGFEAARHHHLLMAMEQHHDLHLVVPNAKHPTTLTDALKEHANAHRKPLNLLLIMGAEMLARPFDMFETPTLYLPPDEYADFQKWKKKNLDHGFFEQRILSHDRKNRSKSNALMICSDQEGDYHPVNIVGKFHGINGHYKHYNNPHIPKFRDNAAPMIQISRVVETLSTEKLMRENISNLNGAKNYAKKLQQSDAENRYKL